MHHGAEHIANLTCIQILVYADSLNHEFVTRMGTVQLRNVEERCVWGLPKVRPILAPFRGRCTTAEMSASKWVGSRNFSSAGARFHICQTVRCKATTGRLVIKNPGPFQIHYVCAYFGSGRHKNTAGQEYFHQVTANLTTKTHHFSSEMSSETTNVAALLMGVGEDLVLKEQPVPTPGASEVLIRNHALAVNPVDWKLQTLGFMGGPYPKILGADLAGVVVKVGSSVDGFKPGDRVLADSSGIMTQNANHGCFQTFTAVDVSSVTKIPDSTSLTGAATLPLAVDTAGQVFFDNLGLPYPDGPEDKKANSILRGDVLLVWGAAGSVGRAVVQLARILGLEVYATASARHHDALRKLGASFVVDYHSPTAVEELEATAAAAGKRPRVAVDCNTSADSLAHVFGVLSDGNEDARKTVVTMLPLEWVQPSVVAPKDVDISFVDGGKKYTSRLDIQAWLHGKGLPAWLESGEMVPGPYRVIPGGLGGLQAALDELKAGAVSGEKLVVEV
ncbi:hypothetical protein MCOR07_002459 [Pyricularia oryzae]|nr:hypothetical protein MCOR24_007971 [Pyricularia oryzae]KAI6468420.1 hypothetical protein MCOR15_002123 [Pyricularia oryzae]KAI6493632.1 hypothetical protein MCOR18_001407 [Pyricularia oryzae]KAI6626447.1 hypothetical protein MCOR07_002459 [Pyricularia oryzae]